MIKIDNSPFRFKKFEQANLNYVFQIVNGEGTFKPWYQIKNEFALSDLLFFKYAQLKDSIPPTWKEYIRRDPINANIHRRAGVLQCTRLIDID